MRPPRESESTLRGVAACAPIAQVNESSPSRHTFPARTRSGRWLNPWPLLVLAEQAKLRFRPVQVDLKDLGRHVDQLTVLFVELLTEATMGTAIACQHMLLFMHCL